MKTLSDPTHRFKVRKNAKQMNLTGMVIFHPTFSMVYVEGAAKFVHNYTRLLTHCIAWTEAARARGTEDIVLDDDNAEASTAGPSAVEVTKTDDPEVSLVDNRCDMVWEGQLRDRVFTNFRPKTCPTDAAGRIYRRDPGEDKMRVDKGVREQALPACSHSFSPSHLRSLHRRQPTMCRQRMFQTAASIVVCSSSSTGNHCHTSADLVNSIPTSPKGGHALPA